MLNMPAERPNYIFLYQMVKKWVFVRVGPRLESLSLGFEVQKGTLLTARLNR